MLSGPFALALAAGMAATLNPCGFAMLPAYVAMFVSGATERDDRSLPASVGRAFGVSASLTVGFVAVFGVFGAVISPLAGSIEKYLPWATIVIGFALVALGVVTLSGREMSVAIPKLGKGGRDDSFRSMLLFGVSYAIASLSCTIGPFLAVTSTTFRTQNFVSGVAMFVAYALGMGLVVTLLTVAVALAKGGVIVWLRRAMPYVSRSSGALLAVAGAYVAWYGWFEVRTLNGGSGSDPIVDRAISVQSWLQNAIVPDRPAVAAAVMGGILVLVLSVIVGIGIVRRRSGSRQLVEGQLVDPVSQVESASTTVPGSS